MSAIVFAVDNTGKKVLIAQGGKWYMDRPGSNVAAAQRSYKGTYAEALDDILTRTPADALVRLPLDQKSDAAGKKYFTTKFIDKVNRNPPGFVKGGIERGEAAAAAAAREFREETFTDIPEGRFNQVGTVGGNTVFRVDLDAAESAQVIANWKQNYDAQRGELVDLQWVPRGNLGALNPESAAAAPLLAGLPGGKRRKTRRSRMLKNPKTLKKRIR